MKNHSDDFVEIPRWVRRLSDRRWFGGAGLSRRDVLVVEAFCVACAVIVFANAFLVAEDARARVALIGVFPLIGCYLTALSIRTMDKYRLWPGDANAPQAMPRTWRTILAEYAYMLGVAVLGVAIILWLMARL